MSGSAHFKSVPIIDVTKENVAIVGPMMRGGIIGSDFIAIDCVRISMKTIEQIIIISLTQLEQARKFYRRFRLKVTRCMKTSLFLQCLYEGVHTRNLVYQGLVLTAFYKQLM